MSTKEYRTVETHDGEQVSERKFDTLEEAEQWVTKAKASNAGGCQGHVCRFDIQVRIVGPWTKPAPKPTTEPKLAGAWTPAPHTGADTRPKS